MSISPQFLDEIKNRLSLSSVIGKTVRLTRAGREFKGCCPFHKEKTPSFTVNNDKQFYHCFGCGAHGDVIGYVMQHNNLQFMDAVEMLAAEAGLQMPAPDPAYAGKQQKKRDLYDMMDCAAAWFEQQLALPQNETVAAYLRERGLGAEALRQFRVGYAPSDRQALRAYLKEQGFSDAEMLAGCLLKTSEKSPEPYVFFRERVVFPVTDRRGRIIAFGGRILPDHLRAEARGDFSPPKYLNSSDTPIFDKGRMLYGEFFARQASREGHTLIVTEGYMDVIACHQAGFKGAVAPMGTALTEEQIAALWGMMASDDKIPVLCFDGDSAGRKAAGRVCERIMPLLRPGCSVRFAFLPDGEDPDSLIKGGGQDSFKAILKSSLPLFEFLWLAYTAGRDFSMPETRAGVVKSLEDQIKRIADRDVQRHYQEALRSRVSETFFQRPDRGQQAARQNVKGAYKSGGIQNLPAAPKPRLVQNGNLHIRIFLASLLNHPVIFPDVEEPLAVLRAQERRLDALREALIIALSAQPELDSAALQSHLRDQGFQKEMGDILSESVYVHAAFASPGYDSHKVTPKWLELWEFVQSRNFGAEMKAGWKQVLQSANTEEETRLLHLLRADGADAV